MMTDTPTPPIRWTWLATALLAAALWLPVLLAAAPARVSAQSPGPAPAPLQTGVLSGEALEARVREIADQLRCPTCQGISVNDSEASFSVQIKDKVRRMLEEGQNEEQIKTYFVSRYGEWILRAPKKEGLGLVLWVLPGAMILLVGGLLIFRLYRNQQSSGVGQEASGAATPVTSGSALTPEQRERIQRDLKRFEEQE